MQELTLEQQHAVSGGCDDCVQADRRPIYADGSVYPNNMPSIGTPVIWTPPPTFLPPMDMQ